MVPGPGQAVTGCADSKRLPIFCLLSHSDLWCRWRLVEFCFKALINEFIGKLVASVLAGSGRVQQSSLVGNTSNYCRNLVPGGGGIGATDVRCRTITIRESLQNLADSTGRCKHSLNISVGV